VADTTIPTELQPIVDEQGIMSLEMSNFINIIGALTIAEGAGSPEGVLSANVSKLYMDTAGTAGSILYIKRDASVGGDTTQGWVEVGTFAGSTLGLFQARKTSAQTLTGTMANITGWLTADKADSPFSFNATTGVLTIIANGWYDLVLYTNNTGTGTRGAIQAQIIDPALIPGTFSEAYYRANGSTSPAVSLPSYLYEVTSQPVDINIQAKFNTATTMTLTAARLTVEKMA